MKTNALTADLTGAALDWAVARCEGAYAPSVDTDIDGAKRINYGGMYPEWSTDWAAAGPIIEREWLDITPWPNESDEELRWQCKQHDSIDCVKFGPTPLIAAMRCFVASRLGDEIEIPDEIRN